MSKRIAERSGINLRILRRRVDFSFWPMTRATRRYGLQSRVFASEPWNVFERAVNEECPSPVKGLALAYLQQSRDFFVAAQLGAIRAAKPLLIYYSFMNLVKTFALTKKLVTTLGDHHHGLTVDFSSGAGPTGVKITAFPCSATTVNLFDLLLKGLSNTSLASKTVFELDWVLPQVLLGHRLWCDAAAETERFIEINRIYFRESKKRKEVLIRFDLLRTEHLRLGYTQKDLINRARLSPIWQAVKPSSNYESDTRVRFELANPKSYTSMASDVLNGVVEGVKYTFWRSITIVPPFRKYYVYLSDLNAVLLPQICSIYLVFFYLGSITRYRPDQFDQLLAGSYGAFLQEFIENQPNQWLYMLSSEFAEQEVTRAAVV
jgi:YaaC-like Protein